MRRSSSAPAAWLRSSTVDSNQISGWVSLCVSCCPTYFLVQAAHKHTASEQLGLDEELVTCSATETNDLGLSDISVLKKA